tara:strand:+ start:1254 stop:2081 length:828 start_codon:yes stop_codon:yes gene_type:complete
MSKLKAYKMDGLGNDFIIFDKRKKSISLTKNQIIKISDRNNVGCDQVIFIDEDKSSDALLKFFNSNGGEISACGNGSRCAAYFLMKENNKKKITLRTKAGVLHAESMGENLVSINMGKPIFEWKNIPLTKDMNIQNLKIKINDNKGREITGGFAISIGNPHIVFFVKNINDFNIEEIGPKIENHNYFPEKSNVTIANIVNKKNISVKVWERGAGLTKACGTAACATVVSGAVLKLNERNADVKFSEGSLNINWKIDDNIYMSGKVSTISEIEINI